MALLGRPVSDARVLREWVGLRPYRAEGLQLRAHLDASTGVITCDNFGHGGSGHTLSVGCADEALRLSMHALQLRDAGASRSVTLVPSEDSLEPHISE